MSLVTIHHAVRRRPKHGPGFRAAAITCDTGGQPRPVGELRQHQGDWQLTVFDPLDDSRYTLPIVHQLESDARAFAQGYFLGHDHGRARIAAQF